MSTWCLEIHDEGYVVFRGAVPLKEFQNVVKKYCHEHWKVDMQWAKELDATFVICKPELAKEWKKDAKTK